MQRSDSYTPNLSFALLLLGPPKLGKTTFALQFPKPYIADCDNNLSGPAEFIRLNNLPPFAYDTINVDDKGREVDPKQRWARLTTCLKTAVADPSIHTVIIDSLTSISEYLIEHVLASEGQKQMRIQDWQPFQFMMKRLVTFLRTTGKLIIFTAHESVEKDEVDGILKYFVMVPTKMSNTFAGMFSDAWRMECQQAGDKYKYQIRTKPTVRFSLGTSIQTLPPIVPADWSEIVKYAPQLEPKNATGN
jgi:hypothetical protein